ncbi:hypothetical protein ABAZ39_14680 (plasmid) [Azospirillum argentinense]|uniref:Uncharacterized protein n=1 Tax=Azospirillum argentinense TaxID=2970906 RepID=A0A060DG85_9PROT|nr:hypothetical protein [Azospirillum argentinense]AIB13206.1 hypothetical protein ABAZ39_14680 [Azospirillum argentinense]EZQ05034.1 hypothetical protein ABAZ39_14905 [Azospirillum argentinense]
MKTLISLDDVESIKRELIGMLPDFKSSHRVEAMARGLGWGSNAALRAELAVGPQTRSPDSRVFSEYLKEHGFQAVKYGALEEAVVRCKFAGTRSAVEAVMAAEPGLSMNGFRTDDFRKSRQEREDEFRGLREEMPSADGVLQFVRACEFLAQVPRRATVNRTSISYDWKHVAERFHRERGEPDSYVSNGMFIAAALHLGFTVKRDGTGPNAFLNIAPADRPRRSRGGDMLAKSVGGPTRTAAWRNMMVAAINTGLDRGLFSLDAGDNRWGDGEGVYRFDFAGLPAIASVRGAGFGELGVSVAVRPTERAAEFVRTANAGFLAGDAFASGWLERKDGKWLQSPDKPMNAFRRDLLPVIARETVEPRGFAASGPFRL